MEKELLYGVNILVVDDNKTLNKLITKKLQASLGCNIDMAFSYEEAREKMNDNNYYIAILDLCLPDAMYGEVVDYALEKEIFSIVLTGLDDKDTREKFMEKPIVDYVLKDDERCIDYIIETIERLLRYKGTKIIIADDSAPVRNTIKNMLKGQYEVLVAAHGEEALNYLEDNPDVKLIITDKEMPVIDGEKLIEEVRAKHPKNELPIIVLTSHDNEATAAKLLKKGANDFITKPFGRESFTCRINNCLDNVYYLKQAISLANTDFLTKLYNRKAFFELSANDSNKGQSAVMMLDIDFFKKINDTYGHDAGDLVIRTCANTLLENTKGGDLVARFGGEEFCILLRNINQDDALRVASKIRIAMQNQVVKYKEHEIKFTVSIGVCKMAADNSNFDEAITRADEALYRAKTSGRNRVEEYYENN